MGSEVFVRDTEEKLGIRAVKVSGNWRITFLLKEGNAYEVDYEDYH